MKKSKIKGIIKKQNLEIETLNNVINQQNIRLVSSSASNYDDIIEKQHADDKIKELEKTIAEQKKKIDAQAYMICWNEPFLEEYSRNKDNENIALRKLRSEIERLEKTIEYISIKTKDAKATKKHLCGNCPDYQKKLDICLSHEKCYRYENNNMKK